jgi:hypothetical protein
MCTVTWHRDDQGDLSFFANRDIGPARAGAERPGPATVDGVAALAPVEHVGGGAWIGVNVQGLILTLLNEWYEDGPTPTGGRISRGRVLRSLLGAAGPLAATERLARADLSDVNPFQLLALDRGMALVSCWRPGRGLERRSVDPARGILTSSSFRTAEVTAARRAQFAALGTGAQAHLEFHRSHHPAAGPHSVCMHRADAATVSLSWIRVNRQSIEFDYHPGPPCTLKAWQRATLTPSASTRSES